MPPTLGYECDTWSLDSPGMECFPLRPGFQFLQVAEGIVDQLG